MSLIKRHLCCRNSAMVCALFKETEFFSTMSPSILERFLFYDTGRLGVLALRSLTEVRLMRIRKIEKIVEEHYKLVFQTEQANICPVSSNLNFISSLIWKTVRVNFGA